MKLRITFLSEGNLAELSISGDSEAWGEIRRDMQAISNEVNNTGKFALTIPWWAFLKSLESLQYRIQKHGLAVVFDDEAKRLLREAQDKRKSYAKAQSTRLAPVSAIQAKLSGCGFSRQLTTHQLRNVRKLAGLPAGATFSVPGAGKTTEALAFYFLRKTKDTCLLVICPKNAFATWQEQFDLCAKNARQEFVRLTGGQASIRKMLSKTPELMVLSYQQVPTIHDLLADHLSKHPTIVFLDESHRIKLGDRGETGRFVLSISHLPVAKLILSGTPMPNSLDDLVPQFNFLFPEVEVDSTQVAASIKPIYVRTTKQELDLPPLRRVAVPIELNPAQRKLYQLMRSEEARFAERTLKARDRIGFRALGKSVMRLLQVISNPMLLAKAGIPHEDLLRDVLGEGDGPKIAYACRRARGLASKGKKVLLWSTFVENVELMAARLKDLGADYIHGKVDTGSDEEAATREYKITRFHKDPDAMVLVANPAACSESISLHTVCHHAIYVDRSYNAAQYMQSEDRIHRLGLPRNVQTTIEILYSPDSIDESVDRRLRQKVGAMARVLDDRGLNIDPVSFDPTSIDDNESLDADDVKDLLRHLKG